MTPTASSDHSEETSQRCSSARSARRWAGATGNKVIAVVRPWPGVGGRRAGLQKELLVDLPRLLAGRDGEQFAGHVHQGAQVALGVIAQGGDHLLGHQLCGSGLVQRLLQAVGKLVGGGAIERQEHPHAAAEGEELVGPQTLDEPPVAGEHDGEQDVGVEPRGGEQPQLGEHGRHHLLRLVDDQRAAERCIDVVCQRSRSTLAPAQRLWGGSSTPNRSPISR
jgi:hypothetical protein